MLCWHRCVCVRGGGGDSKGSSHLGSKVTQLAIHLTSLHGLTAIHLTVHNITEFKRAPNLALDVLAAVLCIQVKICTLLVQKQTTTL